MRRLFDVDSKFMRGLIHIADCICLSVLWLVFSIPIVTMGAASAALYAAVYKYIRRDEGYLWRTFWEAFRENLKRSTLAWLPALALLILLAVDALVFRSMYLQGKLIGNLYWVILILICVEVTWTAWLSAYCARFNGSVKDVLRFSALLMAAHPVKSLWVFLPILTGAALILTAPVLLLIAPAAACWIGSVTMEKVFLLHMRPEDAEKETAGDGDPDNSETEES